IAVRAVQHGPVLSLADSQIENASLMMIDSNGRVVRAHRVNLNTPPVIDGFELEAIKREAFSIPLWEQVNQRTIPYASMFDKTRMSSRLVSSNLSKQQVMSGESTNITYNKVRTRIKQPCTTCGGRRCAGPLMDRNMKLESILLEYVIWYHSHRGSSRHAWAKYKADIVLKRRASKVDVDTLESFEFLRRSSDGISIAEGLLGV